MKAKPYLHGSFPRKFDKHEPPEIHDQHKNMPSKKWRKKYECKKNKGKHSWRIKSINNRIVYAGVNYTSNKPSPTDTHNYVQSDVRWYCAACNKQEREFLSPEGCGFNWSMNKKKLDAHRPHKPY